MAATLVEHIHQVTSNSSARLNVIDASGLVDSASWAEIYACARKRAGQLQTRGIGPGDRVAVLAFTSRAMIESLLAISMCGAAIVVMPLPLRLSSEDAFVAMTRARLSASGAGLLLLDEFFTAHYEPGESDPPAVGLDELTTGSDTFNDVTVSGEELAVLQFTSGSTQNPRAVRLPHRAIVNNMWSMSQGLETGTDEVVVSWLPLYHDMGLIGTLLTPAALPMGLTISAPQAFLSRPAMWMEAASEFRATIICAPNFGYALATRSLKRASGLDLSSIRAALCGAEPVSLDTMQQFREVALGFGLGENALLPVYGLAETTLAVTFPGIADPLRSDTVDRALLEKGERAEPAASGDTKRVVGLGHPLRGIALRVVDDTGAECTDRMVGEILVATNAVMDGYDNHPEATADALRDGWLHTGDLGYLVDGELFVCGRKKDLIIVGGRNIWPEDVEEAAHEVPGVRAGNAIAFGVASGRERESLVLVAETRSDAEQAVATASAVASVVKDRIGLAPREVLMLEAGALPKTSSGKLQRNLCRQWYLDGAIEPIAAHGN